MDNLLQYDGNVIDIDVLDGGSLSGGTKFTPGETLILDENNVLNVRVTDNIEEGNRLPVSSQAVHVQIGNIETLLKTL